MLKTVQTSDWSNIFKLILQINVQNDTWITITLDQQQQGNQYVKMKVRKHILSTKAKQVKQCKANFRPTNV